MNRNVRWREDATNGTATYAAASDFCQVFNEDMTSLYRLSFLLTANRDQAEQCFVGGIEDCVGINRVFKEWTRSWARRAVIQNAIRMIAPSRERADCGSPARPEPEVSTAPANTNFLAAVIQLDALDRFVFVVSVLEQYSDHDCSLLLGCARQELIASRARALQRLADTNTAFALFGENLQGAPAHLHYDE